MTTKVDPIEVLRKLEWSAIRHGMGFGFMGSGNDGNPYPACPCCGGIKPGSHAEREFNATAIGHKPGCEMVAAINS